MEEKLIHKIVKYGVVVFALFVIQRVTRCYVYEYDYISVLFGIFLLAISFILHKVADDMVTKYRLKKRLRQLEKELDELWREYKG